MQLDEEGVEDLVVQAFQLKLLRGRLDQGNERIATTYAITRQFGEQEWIDLKEKVRLIRISKLLFTPTRSGCLILNVATVIMQNLLVYRI